MNPNIPGADNDTQPSYDFLVPYNASAPVAYSHQNLQMGLSCGINGLALIIILARTYLRLWKLGRFQAEDWCMVVAGILLIFPHWVSQIAFTVWGGGLHIWNVKYVWRPIGWRWSSGFVGYYMISSVIKVSIMCTILRILPPYYKKIRWSIYALVFVTISLGVAESLIWLMPCTPIASNFIYTVESTACMILDAPRYTWIGMSIFIDLALVFIPFYLIRGLQMMRKGEKKTLVALFAVNCLGTASCAFSIYGTYINTDSTASMWDETYSYFTFMLCNNIEILMYTICASVSALAPLFFSKTMNARPAVVDLEDVKPSDLSGDSDESGKSGGKYSIKTSSNAAKSPISPKGKKGSIFGWSIAMGETSTMSRGSMTELRIEEVETRTTVNTEDGGSDVEKR